MIFINKVDERKSICITMANICPFFPHLITWVYFYTFIISEMTWDLLPDKETAHVKDKVAPVIFKITATLLIAIRRIYNSR